MGIIKKILLAIIVISGLVNISRQSQEYGIDIGLQLLAVFSLSTFFLWRWACGYMPQIGTVMAMLIMMACVLVGLGIVEYAMADQLHVDLVEVIRISIQHSPWFYLAMFLGTGVKVIFWRWLFAGVREESAVNAAA